MIDIVARAMASSLAKKIEDVSVYDSMIYRGTLGAGCTVEDLPTEDVKNGDTYKVAVAGTYNNIKAREGDIFIAIVSETENNNTIEWTYIPSGDDGSVYIESGTEGLEIERSILENNDVVFNITLDIDGGTY